MKATHATFTQHSPHHFSADASDVGLKPGEWPYRLTIIGVGGNGNPFQKDHVELSAEREVLSVTYLQIGGAIAVQLFND